MKKYSALSTIVITLAMASSCGSQSGQGDPANIIIGTYGHNIYSVEFFEDGTFSDPEAVPSDNASFVIRAEGSTLYSVSENDPSSGVYSYKDGSVAGFSESSLFGPCHLLKWQDYIFTADYGHGSISIFPIVDGLVGQKLSFIQFEGSGPDPRRQSQSHIHQLRLLPESICKGLGIEGEWILASDLGDDSIHILRAGGDNALTWREDLDIVLESGTGPRHMEFNQENNLLYCLSELGGKVYVYRISSMEGEPGFTLVQSVKADLVDAGGSADIHIHPCGKFLYTSHRLENDGVAVFSLNGDGLIEEMTSYHNTGIHPRNFQITSDGKYMLVACRDSYSVEVYGLDESTGALSDKLVSSLVFEEDMPVCVVL